jgi:uncharacterized protein YecA (UPF0149 family)
MALYEEWFRKAYNKDGNANNRFWDEYMPQEQKIYEYILENKLSELNGTVKELAEKFDMSEEFIAGFVDGINDTQKRPVSLENMNGNTQINLEIDFEILFKKMVEYKADHLFNLPQWDNIFSQERRANLIKEQKNSKTIVKEKTPSPNDPCPCGSGKKYKKCCGSVC